MKKIWQKVLIILSETSEVQTRYVMDELKRRGWTRGKGQSTWVVLRVLHLLHMSGKVYKFFKPRRKRCPYYWSITPQGEKYLRYKGWWSGGVAPFYTKEERLKTWEYIQGGRRAFSRDMEDLQVE